MSQNVLVWQDDRGLWYARELRPWGEPAAPRFGPYGTEAEAIEHGKEKG